MIGIVLGSPDPTFRRTLGTELKRYPELGVLGDTGVPESLQTLVIAHRPALLILDTVWLPARPELLVRLLASVAPPRILLCADSLDAPPLLSAVKKGVHGCVARDAHPAIWHRAILAIHAGEPWIPRALMATALIELNHLLGTGSPGSPQMEQLTERQREIVRLLPQGLSNREIGRRLGISPTTVKTHLHNIFERAGVSGRQHLALHVVREARS